MRGQQGSDVVMRIFQVKEEPLSDAMLVSSLRENGISGVVITSYGFLMTQRGGKMILMGCRLKGESCPEGHFIALVDEWEHCIRSVIGFHRLEPTIASAYLTQPAT